MKEKKKITDDMIVLCYEYAKKVYNGEIDEKQAINFIYKQEGMNPGTAKDYLTAFFRMMEGEKYIRTISLKAYQYYLDRISNEYSESGLKIALKAIKKHINYYESVQSAKLKSLRRLVEEYE